MKRVDRVVLQCVDEVDPHQLAHGLAARGYQRGDALGLAPANSAEFLAVYYACAKLGLVCVPIN
ncbi:MAG: AMP-binding protein, partial [Solirubrobacteraceae bacterium]